MRKFILILIPAFVLLGGAIGLIFQDMATGQEFPGANGGKSSSSGQAESQFKDLNEEHWAYNAIMPMVQKEILDGYDDGTFKPDDRVTGEEFLKMLSMSFEVQPGLLDGKSVAKREDVVAALVKAIDPPEYLDGNMLKEVYSDFDKIDENLRNYIAWAHVNDLVRGFPDNTFKPRNEVTRAEAASLLNRALRYKEPVKLQDLLEEEKIRPFTGSEAKYEVLVSGLEENMGKINGFEVNYYAKDINFDLQELVFIFCRVDSSRYFQFSKIIYEENPEILEDFIKNIVETTYEFTNKENVIVSLGYTAERYYNPKDVYSDRYINYNEDRKVWQIERLYAGALARAGNIEDFWLQGQ